MELLYRIHTMYAIQRVEQILIINIIKIFWYVNQKFKEISIS